MGIDKIKLCENPTCVSSVKYYLIENAGGRPHKLCAECFALFDNKWDGIVLSTSNNPSFSELCDVSECDTHQCNMIPTIIIQWDGILLSYLCDSCADKKLRHATI